MSDRMNFWGCVNDNAELLGILFILSLLVLYELVKS